VRAYNSVVTPCRVTHRLILCTQPLKIAVALNSCRPFLEVYEREGSVLIGFFEKKLKNYDKTK